MNILILNASPRHHGNIATMLETMKAEAERQGATVTLEEVQPPPAGSSVHDMYEVPLNPPLRPARRRCPTYTPTDRSL